MYSMVNNTVMVNNGCLIMVNNTVLYTSELLRESIIKVIIRKK